MTTSITTTHIPPFATMYTLQQIEAQAEKVATTAKALAKQCREANFGESSPPWGTAASGASCEAERLRSNMLATLARLQTMLVGPTDFIQHLAHQVLPSIFISPSRPLFIFHFYFLFVPLGLSVLTLMSYRPRY